MQQLMYSFPGEVPPPHILEGVRRGDITAFWLFGTNTASPAGLRRLTDALRQAAIEGGQLPPLIGVDQEGGQLMSIVGGATELPGNMALGATRSPELAEQAGCVLGRELRAMGVNINFAPSLDVNINPLNPVIGIRSFGDDPLLVAQLGSALIRGLQAEGIFATAKHFPGHGDTGTDSHDSVPTVEHSLERINAVELAPFRAAVQDGVDLVMTSHILFTALDPKLPATLSPVILDRLLRRQMGFRGVTITDAMDMHAVARYGHTESVQMALAAGADIVLLGHIPDQLKVGSQIGGWIRPDAVARIQELRARIATDIPSLDEVGSSEHRKIAQTIADRSITVVRDNGALPLRLREEDTAAVITVTPMDLTPADTSSHVTIRLAEAVQKRHPRVQALRLPRQASDNDLRAILEATKSAKVVIIGTISADQDTSQADLVRALYKRGQQPIVVALRTPYDLTAFPMIDTYLCAYGIRDFTTEAVARVLFGEIQGAGTLPCAIPL